MAKKSQVNTVNFIKSPTAKGDLWVNGKKYILEGELTQKELSELFELGYYHLVVKYERRKKH